MSQINITCIDQTAIFTNTPEIFSGDVNVDTVKFNFDNSWNNYETKTAVFYNNPKETYPVMLDENNVAVIPKEVMARKSKLSIGVFGTNANGDVKTSKILTYTIGRGAISDDLDTNSSSMDVWVQLLTRQLYFEDEINAKVETMSDEIDTISDDVDTVESIALGRNQALAYTSYSEMVTALNGMGSDELNRGQNIYIGAVGVPDLWVYGVETETVEYTFVDDDTFVKGLNTGVTVQVGYFKLAQLETQKVDIGKIDTHIDTKVTSENGVHGLRYSDEVLEVEQDGEFKNAMTPNLIWDISDYLQAESRQVSTMPRSITNGYVVKFKDTFYMIGGSTDGSFPSYKYVDGTWVADTVLGGVAILKTTDNRTSTNQSVGGVVANDTAIYYTKYGTGSGIGYDSYGYANLEVYNGTTKTTETNYFCAYNSSYYREGNVGIAIGQTTHYTLAVAGSSSAQYLYLGSTTKNGGKQITNFESAPRNNYPKIWRILSQGICYTNMCVFLITQRNGLDYGDAENLSSDYKNYLLFVTNGGSFVRTVALPDDYALITDMVVIGNYIYVTSLEGYVIRWGFNTMKWESVYGSGSQVFGGSLVEHEGEIHRFDGAGHYATKLYRTAKTYAPKGTKIYLPYESKALTDNLETIEGGYIVKESGNISIAMYDY